MYIITLTRKAVGGVRYKVLNFDFDPDFTFLIRMVRSYYNQQMVNNPLLYDLYIVV